MSVANIESKLFVLLRRAYVFCTIGMIFVLMCLGIPFAFDTQSYVEQVPVLSGKQY